MALYRFSFISSHQHVGPVQAVAAAAVIAIDWPSITSRIQQWTILHPGEAMTLTGNREQMHCAETRPGVYEFWAVYSPPAIRAEDQQALREMGIDFPYAELVSRHITFVQP